jgi:hypothetical protein
MRTIVIADSRSAILNGIRGGAHETANFAHLVVTIVLCGATYGAALGAWHDARLAYFDAIKVPLLLLTTAALTALLNWIVAALLGLSLRFVQTVLLSLFPLAIASVVLASAAPIAAFMSISLPPPNGAQETLHNVLYLVHTCIVAAAGVTGTSFLRTVLIDISGDARVAVRVHRAWIGAFAVVGGEVAWILRPFIGSVYLPVAFLRGDAFHGNVYEFMFTVVIPHLLRSLTR